MKQIYLKRKSFLGILTMLFLAHVYGQVPNSYNVAGSTDAQLQGAALSSTSSIIINEVDVDTPSVDGLEFIELYDGGTGNTALDGLVVVFYNGSDDLSSNSAIDLDGLFTDENGYFVIGSAGVNNVDLVAFTTNGIQNGADAIALYEGDATSFSNDTPILVNETLVDALVYDTNDGDDAALLVLLNPGEVQVNEDELGDKDNHSMQRITNGSGGARNTSTYVTSLPTPGIENVLSVIPPDTETPSIPLNLMVSGITATGTVLSWDESTDNIGVTGYQVFNGTTQITTVATPTYSVIGLTPNTAYSFTVKAIDAANNTSALSNVVSITTLNATVITSSIIINEADIDTPGTDALEFIELYDGGTGNTALDGLVVVFYNGGDDLSYNSAIDLDGYSTDENGYFVIGSAGVKNVDLISFTTNGMQNGADAIALYQGDATSFTNDTAILINETLLDALVYDTDDSDAAGLLVLLNSGEAQVNENELGDKNNHSMQRITNGSGGARNTSTYTSLIPSPGTENGAVIPAPPVISILEARNTAVDEIVTVSGVLTVSDEFAGSAYIQDKTAAIAIFDAQVYGEGIFQIGDSITVTGQRSAFNDQVQISLVTEVENNGLPNEAITPVTITLAELVNHPAELVKVINPNFPKPGDILFGNSNYTLNDASGNGSLRIDNDVEAIVGLGQPETCTEIIGVVGRFFASYQLLPRMQTDMACAESYVPIGSSVTYNKSETFDVVTWNIEWFGDETNSPAAGDPASDAIQKENVKTVIQELNADVYAVQEIADEVLFAQMISELPGYDYVLSDAVSYPNDTEDVHQKVGFIYNTSTVSVVSTKPLLEAIHPYYNGGDDSALNNYPVADKTRFYASGRLPFVMKVNVSINGETKQFDIVALHARANSGTSSQERYDMRKYDVEVLKDSLDTHYSSANLIVLGDYNDDVDETVADNVSTTISTYDAYVNDPAQYSILSSALSAGDYRSYAFRENMIDHIMISNEVDPLYINESVSVGYEFYNANYTATTSDHFPVEARFLLEESTLSVVNEFPDLDTKLMLYPNPFKSVVSWNMKYDIDKIVVYSILGKEVLSLSNLRTNSIDLEVLHNGIYVVKLFKNNEVIATSKIIKE